MPELNKLPQHEQDALKFALSLLAYSDLQTDVRALRNWIMDKVQGELDTEDGDEVAFYLQQMQSAAGSLYRRLFDPNPDA